MRVRSTLLVIGLLGLLPASALAAEPPVLGIHITRTPETVPANEELITYSVGVKNEGIATPEPGDELPCSPEIWLQTSSFSYQWVREGVPLESGEDIAHGSRTATYTVQAADAGAQLQCLVTGENMVENSVDHTVGHRIGVTYASQPATVVAPLPSESGPTVTGNESAARPATNKVGGGSFVENPGDELTCISPSSHWNTIATASTAAGSKTLTKVTTATGLLVYATVVKGSTSVQFLPETTTGRYLEGQTLVGIEGWESTFAAGTTIERVEGTTLILSKPVASTATGGSNPVVAAGSQPLEAGQGIAGAGIPAGTTIEAVSGRTAIMSAPATATGTGVPITDQAAGIGVWHFEWLLNGTVRPGTPGSYPAAGEVTGTTATTSTFKVAASELEQPGGIQCVAWATNGEGTAGQISESRWTTTPAPEVPSSVRPVQGPSRAPSVETGSPTAGPVHIDFELPGGAQTRIYEYKAEGWSCTAHQPSGATHASIDCEREDALGPQQSYPELRVKTSIFGPDLEQPAVAVAEVEGGGAVSARAEDVLALAPPITFGIESLATMVLDRDGADYTQAGGHPFSSALALAINPRIGYNDIPRAVEFLKDIDTDLPPGFVANPQAAPRECATVTQVSTDTYAAPTCPRESIVGAVDVDTSQTGPLTGLPLYLLHAEDGAPAELIFSINGYNGGAARYPLIPRLRSAEGYAISVEAPSTPKYPLVKSISVKLCGYGAILGPPLGGEGSQYKGVADVTGCRIPGEPGANPRPLVTNPTRCSGTPPVTKVSIDSWEKPGAFHSAEAVSPEVTGCGSVPFEPTIAFEPTTHRAESPTGLDVTLKVPSEGLETPGAISQSDLKKALVTLPKGMSVNPSAADGLGACSPGQITLGTNDPVKCPESSKIGSAEITTPLLERPLQGSIYLAEQGHNPFGSLLALYLVVESAERGILVKIPGRVEPQADGQILAEFDENPQVPFSKLELHFNSGPRAALMTPPSCGTYGVVSKLYPWAHPGTAMESTDTFQITEGPNGGACPGGGLAPQLNAGLANPIAATTSPFTTQLTREDGSGRFTGLNLALPPGVTAYLKGVPYCPDSAIASISEAEGTGQAQIEHPSCPAASEIGSVSAGVGAGPTPYYVNTGHLYLAGPYKGAPISILAVIPAVAGPFDLGSVVVRNPAFVDPETAQVTVRSDPIPTVVHGIPVDARDIRIDVDRPHFTLAPTSCEAKAVTVQVFGEGAAAASVSNRFQVGGCSSLPFQPKLKVSLKGSTKRIGHPALTAELTARPGEAGIARAQVNLPHGEFLDQGNLNKTCTRPVLLAGACPASTAYGKVKAWTPLLEAPLEGNVYLVGGYGYQLPALVADLDGQIRVTLVGKVDSGPNKGIRNTFEVVPDAPVSRFVLEMKGGKKYGLLENSEDLCKATKKARQAIVRFTGQNGKVDEYRPVVTNQCKKSKGTGQKKSG
ncbi:MAG TPA: hypothetical protein VMH33_04730 [Solirubrobacterales bacterium]|nr:hypothetical protein [Solirubrobacterales bacterium]